MARSSDPRVADLNRFLESGESKVFACEVGHPARPNPFCLCHQPWYRYLPFYAKAALLQAVLRLPFNAPKLWLLRRMGARIGSNVYISVNTWIDPTFTQLLTIEDDVLLGMEVRIVLHEFNRHEFRAGRVTIRSGSVIGAFTVIGPGVEVGKGALVAACSVVGRDVREGAAVGGNPAREVRVDAERT